MPKPKTARLLSLIQLDSSWSRLVNLHLVVLVAYALVLSLTAPVGLIGSIYWLIRLAVGLLAIFGLWGIDLTILLEASLGRLFSRLEQLIIISFSSLLIQPLLVSIEHNFLMPVPAQLPLANVAALLLLTLIIRFFRPSYRPLTQWSYPVKQLLPSRRWWTLILSSLAGYLVLIFAMTHLYYPLPETDSYYWYTLYQPILLQGDFLNFEASRPLFSSLAFIVNRSIGLDLYTYFKYFLPSLLLLLVLPSLLLARTQPDRLRQWSWLGLPAITAASLNYFFIPIPHAVISTILVACLLLILYARVTNRVVFYYLSGAWLLLSYFYHELMIIIFLPWLVITLIYNRHQLVGQLKQNRVAAVVSVLLVLSHAPTLITGPLAFAYTQFSRFAESAARLHTNWRFPAYFINVDGRSVGWGNLAGVAKYYLYYLGPAVAWLLICALWLLITNGRFRRYLKKELSSHQETAALLTIFVIFLSISEIFPRLVSFAYLPDRAAAFTAIFSSVWLFLISNFEAFKPKSRQLFCLVFILGIVINIAAAIHIESLKRFSINTAQLNSTSWIKQNLPEDRLMITDNDYGLLRVHADSEVCGLGNRPEFYFEQESLDKSLADCLGQTVPQLEYAYQENLSEARQFLEFLSTSTTQGERQQALAMVEKNLVGLRADLTSIEQLKQRPSRTVYIYYSAKSDNFLYKDRPYNSDNPFRAQPFIFDVQTEKYQRVYADESNHIFIWQVL